MLTLCPTADYEIYLGRNLLPSEQVLFEPAAKLLEVWEEFGIRGTLFPDICCAWRHRELAVGEFAGRFESQLQGAARRGHDVQLHLHPEWQTATHDDGAWRFAPHSGSLHDLGFELDTPSGAPALIRRGRAYLESLLAESQPGYRCVAFRAGGWILQPELPLVAALRAAGIRADATVIPGVRLLRTDYRIDFREVPARANWFVGAPAGLRADSGSRDDLLEIPIAAYRGRNTFWHHAANEMRLRRRGAEQPEPRRGMPITKVGPKLGAWAKLASKYRKLSMPRALDIADTHEAMLATLRSYLRRDDCRRTDLALCMNGHPKDTYDFHLKELRLFLHAVTTEHADLVRFETLADCAGRMLADGRASSSRDA